MEPPRGASRAPLALLLLFALSAALAPGRAAATGVFEVRRKFPRHDGSGAGGGKHLADLREHDARRHGRSLAAAVDLPLGGNGLPTQTGLYFTEIGIGTPAKSYYVQVDTGSDILWVNCVSCDTCPRKSGLGIELTLYDPSGSSSGTGVTCSQEFCVATHGGEIPSCVPAAPCQYSISYGDGSSTTGFFVTDFLQYNQVSGNSQTTLANTSITFGCGAKIGGDLGSSSQALDGILGFGQANSSMLSQLAAAGKVRKVFSHCLDTINGGGIFAIGDVVQPKVSTTPLVPGMPHYNVNLEAIDVGGVKVRLPANIFDIEESKGTIIDSGTTLAYLPEVVYNAIMSKVFAQYGDMPLKNDQDFQCFRYSGSVDDGFPIITFHFEGGLPLNIHPHDYLFQNGELYCMGFQTGGLQTKDGKDMVLLGDLAFSNRLVLYDLENQVIGWNDYNCSSSIKIKDDKTGSIYTLVQAIILLGTGEATGGCYTASKYVVLAIHGFFLVLHGLINSLPIRWLSWFGKLGAFWNTAGAFTLVILIPAVAKERASAKFIFTHFNDDNGMGIHGKAYILALGLLTSQYSLLGYDASAHMIEETKNADWSGPMGIISSVALSTTFGWIFLVALTSIVTDIPYLLSPDNDAGGYAVAQALYAAFDRRYGSGVGGLVCVGVVAVGIFFAGAMCIASNSRMGYAFSRDRAMPLSRVWLRVSRNEVPLNVVWLSVVVAFVMALTSLGSQVAFQAMVSIATLGQYIAYALPIFFRVTTARRSFVPGPFHLGRYGVVVGWAAVLWVAFLTVLFSLPVAYPVAKDNFNYTPVAVGGVLLFSVGAWVLNARFWFEGPITNVDL